MSTQGVSTFQIDSKFASGNLVFYEKGVGRTVTGDVFTIGTAAVKVGGTSQDVDFQVYGTSSVSAVIDIGAASFTLTNLTTIQTATVSAAENMLDIRATVSAPNNQSGMVAYFDSTINGTTAGHCYNVGSWINTGPTAPVLAAGHIIVPFEGGVYTGEAQANARIVFGGQHQAILAGAPASLHAWRLNTNQTITALIAAANAGSIAYEAGVGAGTAVGWVKFCEVVGGPTPGYIKIYSGT